jgi:hypothetical protein
MEMKAVSFVVNISAADADASRRSDTAPVSRKRSAATTSASVKKTKGISWMK